MAQNRSDDSPFADFEIGSVDSLESLRASKPVSRRGRSALRSAPSEAMDFESSESPLDGRNIDKDTCVFESGGDDETGLPFGRSSDQGPALPRPGDEVGGFRLISELGRGAFARVFLAEEANLAGRRVALKVSAAEGDEPQILARLQHAHIVPVHSVHDDPKTGLRLLCMPYLGGANLAQVLEEAQARCEGEAGRPCLIAALDRLTQRQPPVGVDSPVSSRRESRRLRLHDSGSVRLDPAHTGNRPTSIMRGGPDRPSRKFAPLRWMLDRPASEAAGDHPDDDLLPARRFLRRADPIRAAVWVVARLAEGLEHAHSRGLLHRDLKPSNVLMAADGTPMLLDFNLSVEAPTEDQEADASIARAMLGGTLPYMSPEHLDALDPQGSTSPEAVDERSDIYSLGLILFEMIAGESPFPTQEGVGGSLGLVRRMIAERQQAPPSLRARVPEVPYSLDALAAKCLAPNPDDRYACAGDLAEDLRRFLDDLPMKYGPEPSLAERAAKWARRHPAACSSTSTAGAAAIVLGLVMILGLHVYEATEALHARLMLRKFQRDSQECQFLLNASNDEERLHRGLLLAPATLEAAGVDEAQGVLGGDWILRLEAAERTAVRESIVDLILEDVHARVIAAKDESESRRRQVLESAVARLDRLAVRLPAPPSVLFRQRSRYRAALGDGEGAERDRREAAARPPKTCRDWTTLGMFHLSMDDLTAAEQALREAVALDVTSFWAWFALGHCHYEQKRYPEAVGDFTACVVTRPDYAWGHFNRGVALSLAGRPREAADAYSRALTLDPNFLEARANRGLVELELNEPAKAELDLRKAILKGRNEPRVAAALADALNRQGKSRQADDLFNELLAHSPSPEIRAARGVIRLRNSPEKAAEDFNAVLAEQPNNPLAHYGLANVLRCSDSAAALRHLDEAIEAEPNFFDAVELRAVERARVGKRAALDDIDRLVAHPTANGLYNASCALALLGEHARALELLGRAVASGFPPDHAASDPDMASLRDRPEFRHALETSPTAR
ncbi:serine/threonine-protein kinase [Paludisphaera rhizosphaerae]|uniref:serine/threonine-protein kinase n=1 Tax=Paludisphaera rhizosphaerae TaxID=2711216 RepID=UPI0013EC1A57|nr:serine/threonine-protein kinase [Paludisphaera rhizosphaerae]